MQYIVLSKSGILKGYVGSRIVGMGHGLIEVYENGDIFNHVIFAHFMRKTFYTKILKVCVKK